MSWIRSQTKESLLNMVSFYVGVDPYTKTASINGETTHDTDWLLGRFTTEEAALAELDAIEWWLNGGGSGVYQIKKG